MNRLLAPIGILAILVVAAFWINSQQSSTGTNKGQSTMSSNSPSSSIASSSPKSQASVSAQPSAVSELDISYPLKFPGVLADKYIKNKKAIITTSKGVIEFNLYSKNAPKTVSNFVYLVTAKFYDGLTFHRVEPGFVVQGGDPVGNGSGGPGYKFDDEPVVDSYLEGTVAMANSGPNTNGSQFFICLADQPSLPKSYNIFGKVTKGMDVVKKIAVGDKITSIVIQNI